MRPQTGSTMQMISITMGFKRAHFSCQTTSHLNIKNLNVCWNGIQHSILNFFKMFDSHGGNWTTRMLTSTKNWLFWYPAAFHDIDVDSNWSHKFPAVLLNNSRYNNEQIWMQTFILNLWKFPLLHSQIQMIPEADIHHCTQLRELYFVKEWISFSI